MIDNYRLPIGVRILGETLVDGQATLSAAVAATTLLLQLDLPRLSMGHSDDGVVA